MKILISGGTGLVGKELGKALVKKGHEIFVLTRNVDKAVRECPFPQTPVSYNNLADHPWLGEIEAIINLAGANLADRRWNKKYKETIYNSRVKTTQMLVELANQKCPNLQCFVSTSGVGIYGDTGSEVVTEDHPQSFEFLGKLCQDWESPLTQLEKARPVVLRVGVVFSEKGGAFAKMVPPIQAGFGGPLGNGKQYMSWIDVEDLVNMYAFAVENKIEGTFNAVSPNPESNNKITETIANHLGTKAFFPVPYPILRLVVGEMAPHLVENQVISSQKIQDKGFVFKFGKLKDSIEKRVPNLTGMQRRVIFEQWINKPRPEVFPFFAEVKNLEDITPPNLNFKVLNSSTDNIKQGTIINYKLKIDGIPIRWQTLIKKWDPPHLFVDNQEKGPYKKWYHIHNFEDLAGGTLMTDQVDLEIPLGIVGYSAAAWKVLSDVNKIFKFRNEIISNLYN